MSILLAALASLSAGDVRAVWVTRFEYRTEADVRAIVRNSAAMGFNTILFQVRGEADAYYRSRIEPWAERLGGRDPGFDPLGVACREGARAGIGIHAWINVFTAWRGTTPPRDPRHVTYRHPEWIVVDRNGRRQTWNHHYVVLNPCLPEVRAHVAAVAADIAARYPVAGVHLDYVRFLEGDWSHDRRTLRLFGQDPRRNPRDWDAFRRNAVTAAVERIASAVHAARPGATMSAAVYPTAEARRKVLQDPGVWLRNGLVDLVYPMTYTSDDRDFGRKISEGYALFGGRCLPGVGAYKHAGGSATVRQLRMCRSGFAVFSYSSLFVSPDEKRREDARLCRSRRDAIRRELAAGRP